MDRFHSRLASHHVESRTLQFRAGMLALALLVAVGESCPAQFQQIYDFSSPFPGGPGSPANYFGLYCGGNCGTCAPFTVSAGVLQQRTFGQFGQNIYVTSKYLSPGLGGTVCTCTSCPNPDPTPIVEILDGETWIIEARLRVLQINADGVAIGARDGRISRDYFMFLNGNGPASPSGPIVGTAWLGGGSTPAATSLPFDLSMYHIYRLEGDSCTGAVTLTIDGGAPLVGSIPPQAPVPPGFSTGFVFGDNSNNPAGGSADVDWDYVLIAKSGSTPATGQPNSSAARLEINGSGAGTIGGPYCVQLGPPAVISMAWTGPPGAPLILGTGGQMSQPLPCIGLLDIGPGVAIIASSLLPGTLNSLFQLNSAGAAQQTFSVPAPAGTMFNLQGAVVQPPGPGCGGSPLLTAAFYITVL